MFSFIIGLLGGALGVFIGVGGIMMLKWIGAISYFGNWVYYVAIFITFLFGCIGYGVGSGYANDNESDFIYGCKKISKKHPWIGFLVRLFLFSIVIYFSYHVWIYCDTKYPIKIAIFITVISIVFNIVFLSSFTKLWKNLVSSEKASAGIALTSAIALIITLALDYSYVLAPSMGWKPLSKIGEISKPVVSQLAPENSVKSVASEVKHHPKKKKTKKKSTKKRNSSTSVATDATVSNDGF